MVSDLSGVPFLALRFVSFQLAVLSIFFSGVLGAAGLLRYGGSYGVL
jgi:hypothetical protein